MKITCPDCSTSYEIKAKALGSEGRSVKCAKCGNRWFVSASDEDDVITPATSDAGESEDAAEAVPEVEDSAKDEADWAADVVQDDAVEDAASPMDDEADVESPVAFQAQADESRFAAELAEDDDEDPEPPKTDIESQAKRPKIIVNPNKFRRNHIGAVLDWIFRRNFRRIGGIFLFAVALSVFATFVLMRNTMVKQSPDLASLFQMIGFHVNLRGLEFRNLRIFNEVGAGNRVLVVEGSIRNLLSEVNPVPAVRLSIRDQDMQEVYAWTIEPTTKVLNGLDETRFRTILADPPKDATDIQVRFVNRGKRQVVLE